MVRWVWCAERFQRCGVESCFEDVSGLILRIPTWIIENMKITTKKSCPDVDHDIYVLYAFLLTFHHSVI
jgi:hypothetical protein